MPWYCLTDYWVPLKFLILFLSMLSFGFLLLLLLLTSSSAIFSSVESNLLLSPSSEVFISQLSKTPCCAWLLPPYAMAPKLPLGRKPKQSQDTPRVFPFPQEAQPAKPLSCPMDEYNCFTDFTQCSSCLQWNGKSHISFSFMASSKISSCAILGNAKLENLCGYFRPVFIFLSHYSPIIY